ncbi:MAG TPA: hypothetical protein VF824_02535 [Thermoanaerobaculia bacterium]|jgi:hypothetical protein
MALPINLGVLRDALQNDPLARIGDGALQTKLHDSVRLGPIDFAPSGTLSVRVLNRDTDKDEDAVFSGGANPHIAFDLQNAWIKYKLSAKAAANAGLVKSAADVELCDYRIHSAAQRAWDAVSSDLGAPRTLLSLADVQSLEPGEALAMELGGALSATVSFSWSDVVSAKLSEILEGFPAIGLKLRKGLETSLSAKITDRFTVVISRTPDRRFRIAVKKAASRDHTYSLEAAVGAEASAMPLIDDVLDPLVNALEEKTGERIADAARGELRKRLAKAATWKATVGLAYEYARIDEQTAIADYILGDAALLPHDHELALAGDFGSIAAELRTDGGARTLVRYLNESTLTRRSSFGFSLGIGKWIDVRARDESAFRQTTRTSLDGFHLVTCRGTRKYEEKNIPGNDFEWVVDLKAQMDEFRSQPTTLDFDYGLHLLVTLERDALSRDDLRRMLDFARMWDVCAADEATFADALGRKTTLRVQLTIDREALLPILTAFDADRTRWAEPLAVAMPYMSTFPERNDYAKRRETYAPAWHEWLRDRHVSFHATSGIQLLEERGLPGSFAWCSGEGHPHLADRLAAFMHGAALLREAMTHAQPVESIANAYASLQQFWTQRLYIAACGRYLLDRAAAVNANVTRTLQADFDDVTVTG